MNKIEKGQKEWKELLSKLPTHTIRVSEEEILITTFWDNINKTIMKTKEVKFDEAIEALKEGKRVQRSGWNGKGLFVFMQKPSRIGMDIVPDMQSLPKSVKDEFVRRYEDTFNIPREYKVDITDKLSIRYNNQMALVDSKNNISGWAPSGSDALAEDWIILD